MQINTPHELYLHAFETENSSAQIVMLYDATINYIKQAQSAISANDHDSRYKLIEKAMAIIHGLRTCLDFSISEDIANALDHYYDALDNLMIEVQCNPDEKLCDTIIENLNIIKNAWKDITLYEVSNFTNNNPGYDNTNTTNLLI